MASYVFARICDERHESYEAAVEYVADLVTAERYYTRHEAPPRIMRRTPMVGIGSHGGRGLFTLGVCSGLEWEELGDEELPYRHRIEVIWDGAIYAADYETVLAGVTKYNRRSWTSATREDYRRVFDRILESTTTPAASRSRASSASGSAATSTCANAPCKLGPDGHRAHTVQQIANEFGVTRPTIYRHLQRQIS